MRRWRGSPKRTGLINGNAPGRNPKTGIGSGSLRRDQKGPKRASRTGRERTKRAAGRLRRGLVQSRALLLHPDAPVRPVPRSPAAATRCIPARFSQLSIWAAAPPPRLLPSVRKVCVHPNLAKTRGGTRSMRRTGAIGRPQRVTSLARKGRASPGGAVRTVRPLRSSRTATHPSARPRARARTENRPGGADRGPRAPTGGGGLPAPRRMGVRM